jgi:hypothetical protein
LRATSTASAVPQEPAPSTAITGLAAVMGEDRSVRPVAAAQAFLHVQRLGLTS